MPRTTVMHGTVKTHNPDRGKPDVLRRVDVGGARVCHCGHAITAMHDLEYAPPAPLAKTPLFTWQHCLGAKRDRRGQDLHLGH